MKAKLLELGGVPGGMSPDAFGEIVKREVAKWPDVVAKTALRSNRSAMLRASRADAANRGIAEGKRE